MTLRKDLRTGLLSHTLVSSWAQENKTSIREILESESKETRNIWIAYLILVMGIFVAHFLAPSLLGVVTMLFMLVIMVGLIYREVASVRVHADLRISLRQLRQDLSLGEREALDFERILTLINDKLHDLALRIVSKEKMMNDTSVSFEARTLAGNERALHQQAFDRLWALAVKFSQTELVEPKQNYFRAASLSLITTSD